MFSRARRETGHGGPRVKSDRRRPSSKAVVGVEPLEGRMLLSYLVVVKNHKVIPVHGGDARVSEPLFGNGLAIKKQANFYTFYDGPRTPNLDGVSATAVFSGNRVTDGTLTLTGTVAGPIIAKPKDAAQEAIYTFAIDRGGAAKAGPFPGRTHIRFDAVVVVPLTLGGITTKNPPYVQINNASTNSPSDDDHNEPEHLKRHDQGGYHNDQSPTGHLDNQSDPIDRQGHRPVELQLLHTPPITIRFRQERLPQHCQLHP